MSISPHPHAHAHSLSSLSDSPPPPFSSSSIALDNPSSAHTQQQQQQPPWRSPPTWPSSSSRPSSILPKDEPLLQCSDMVPSLLHSQDESFLGNAAKLPCDLLHYDPDPGPPFRGGSSELGKEGGGSRPVGVEGFHLTGNLPVVFSSLDMFKPLSGKDNDLACFQSQGFGSPLKGGKGGGGQKPGHAVAFESDFQHFGCHLQPGDGSPSSLHRSENGLLPKGLISSPPIGICRRNLPRHRSSPASLISQIAVDAQEIGGSNGEMSAAQISGPFIQASSVSAGALTEDSRFTGVAGTAAPECTAETDGGEWDGSAMSHGSSFMSMLDDISPRRKDYGNMGGNLTMEGFTLETEGKASGAVAGAIRRHLSLPVACKRRAEPGSGDNWVQDSVPCRLRAKRGCATHPRSIAERVRRTRISERMRKLQELVPNMEKQTNISDMLDEAIEYVKFLQKELQEVSQKRPCCQGLCKLGEKSKEPN